MSEKFAVAILFLCIYSCCAIALASRECHACWRRRFSGSGKIPAIVSVFGVILVWMTLVDQCYRGAVQFALDHLCVAGEDCDLVADLYAIGGITAVSLVYGVLLYFSMLRIEAQHRDKVLETFSVDRELYRKKVYRLAYDQAMKDAAAQAETPYTLFDLTQKDRVLRVTDGEITYVDGSTEKISPRTLKRPQEIAQPVADPADNPAPSPQQDAPSQNAPGSAHETETKRKYILLDLELGAADA